MGGRLNHLLQPERTKWTPKPVIGAGGGGYIEPEFNALLFGSFLFGEGIGADGESTVIPSVGEWRPRAAVTGWRRQGATGGWSAR